MIYLFNLVGVSRKMNQITK